MRIKVWETFDVSFHLLAEFKLHLMDPGEVFAERFRLDRFPTFIIPADQHLIIGIVQGRLQEIWNRLMSCDMTKAWRRQCLRKVPISAVGYRKEYPSTGEGSPCKP